MITASISLLSGKVKRTNGTLKLKISKLAEKYWTPLAKAVASDLADYSRFPLWET